MVAAGWVNPVSCSVRITTGMVKKGSQIGFSDRHDTTHTNSMHGNSSKMAESINKFSPKTESTSMAV
jgi:hypothetical protein